MLTTERRAALLREAVLGRLPRPGGVPATPPTEEEADFIAQHHDDIQALAAHC